MGLDLPFARIRFLCRVGRTPTIYFQRLTLKSTRHPVSGRRGENRRFFNVEFERAAPTDIHPILLSAALDAARQNYKNILSRAARDASARLCGLSYSHPAQAKPENGRPGTVGNGQRVATKDRRARYIVPLRKPNSRGGWGESGDDAEGRLCGRKDGGGGARGKRRLAARVFCRDVVVHQRLKRRGQLGVGSFERREFLAVDVNGAARGLSGARQADTDVGGLGFAGAVDDAAHHRELQFLDALV